MHHRIWLLVIVITSTNPASTPQPTISMCLFSYVKIIEKNSVKWEYLLWLTNLYKVNEKFCLEKQTNKNAKVNIKLQDGFANDKLTLDVSCEDCKGQCSDDEPNSIKCNRQGNLVCGGCHCK